MSDVICKIDTTLRFSDRMTYTLRALAKVVDKKPALLKTFLSSLSDISQLFQCSFDPERGRLGEENYIRIEPSPYLLDFLLEVGIEPYQ